MLKGNEVRPILAVLIVSEIEKKWFIHGLILFGIFNAYLPSQPIIFMEKSQIYVSKTCSE